MQANPYPNFMIPIIIIKTCSVFWFSVQLALFQPAIGAKWQSSGLDHIMALVMSHNYAFMRNMEGQP